MILCILQIIELTVTVASVRVVVFITKTAIMVTVTAASLRGLVFTSKSIPKSTVISKVVFILTGIVCIEEGFRQIDSLRLVLWDSRDYVYVCMIKIGQFKRRWFMKGAG